jgi:hypothetical protein
MARAMLVWDDGGIGVRGSLAPPQEENMDGKTIVFDWLKHREGESGTKEEALDSLETIIDAALAAASAEGRRQGLEEAATLVLDINQWWWWDYNDMTEAYMGIVTAVRELKERTP